MRSSQIRDMLCDEESRCYYDLYVRDFLYGNFDNPNNPVKYELVANALRYAMDKAKPDDTNDNEYSVVQCINDYKSRYKKLYIWPASQYACFISKLLLIYGVETEAFIDRDPDKVGQSIAGCPVITPDEYQEQCADTGLLIGGLGSYFSIWNDIHEMRLREKGCILYDIDRLYEKQYFGPSFMQPIPNEVFLDVGCAGYTIPGFVEFAKGDYQRIIGFEAITHHYNQVVETTREYRNVDIYNFAAWSSNASIDFLIGAHEMAVTSATRIGSEIRTIKAVRIDDIVKEKVTLVKMDIEGAELEALKGAAGIISKYRPRMAISIYHNERDIIDIPRFICSQVADYSLYIRHHSAFPWETVLYAI